jgi:hypothetical protein
MHRTAMNAKHFNFQEFHDKKSRLKRALSVIISNLNDWEDVDQEALDELKSLLFENKESIDFVKYASPFPLEVIVNSLATLSNQHVDREDFDPIIQELLDLETNYDSWRTWTEYQIVELFESYDSNTLIDAFATVRSVCIKQNPNVEESRIPHIDWDFVNKVKEKGFVNTFFDDLRLYLDTNVNCRIGSEEGFGGIIFGWLNLGNVELSRFWNHSNYVYYENTYSENKVTFNHEIPTLISVLPKVDDSPIGPFWLSKQITKLDFYCESIHLTDSFKNEYETEIHISADSLVSKTSDYKRMGAVTFGRDIESKSAKQVDRGLLFSWSRQFLCNYGYEKISHSDDIFGYGDDCIFIFSNCLISSAVSGDHDIQSVSLLQSVVEAIPCKIEFISPNFLAFIGINNEKDNALFLVDTENYKPSRTPFPCYVLDEVCKHLYFHKSDSDNLNCLFVPSYAEWKDYYE